MKILLTLIALVFYGVLISQEDTAKKACPETENKKALKLYEKIQDRKKYKKPERILMLQEAIQLDSNYAAAYLKIAQEMVVLCKLNNSSFAPTVPYFMKAVEICPQIHSSPYYYIGFYYYEKPNNDSAIYWLRKFMSFSDKDENKFDHEYTGQMYQAKEMINYAKKENALKKRKPVPFNPSVVQGVSSINSEYLPYLSPNEQLFLYTRALPDDKIDRVYHTDKEKEVFTMSVKKPDGTFDGGVPMPYPFNQNDNEGGATLTIDNKLLYYAQSHPEGATPSNTDIYFTSSIGGDWDEIKKVPGINHPVYWDSQPTVSSDGNTIIFVSDRPGGFGKLDLYITTKDSATKTWGVPKNLGPRINTAESEKTPFLHSDSETLYFSSNGLFGYGGYDIFFARKDDKGTWKVPENIGAPINGEGDDLGFFVSTDGKFGYFCSWDEGKVSGKGIGKYDIYQFELYKEARPEAVVIIKGEIKKEHDEPLTNFKVEVKNMKTHEKTLAVMDSTTGEYSAAINMKRNGHEDVVITANADEHAFTSQVVKITDSTSFKNPPKPEAMEIKKADKGVSIVLNNIYYATGAEDLYPQSYIILDEFAEFLKNHPTMKIEIQGHTDNVGNASENLKLSQHRANKVVTYLVEKGINKENITGRGYGSSKPVAENSSVEGRSKNRRTEFLIVDK